MGLSVVSSKKKVKKDPGTSGKTANNSQAEPRIGKLMGTRGALWAKPSDGSKATLSMKEKADARGMTVQAYMSTMKTKKKKMKNGELDLSELGYRR